MKHSKDVKSDTANRAGGQFPKASILLDDLKREGDWRQRRASIYFIAEALRQGQVPLRMEPSNIPQVFLHFAKDSKWEVRKAVADNISSIVHHEKTYSEIVSILKNDNNAFVKQAIENSIKRKPIKARTSRYNRLVSKYDQDREIQKIYGSEALQMINNLTEKQIELIVSEFTHDLRDILAVIRMKLSSVLAETSSQKAEMIEQQFEFLEHTISDLRTYSKPVIAVKENENLADIVRIAAEMAAIAMQEHGYKTDHVLITISIDDQIVVNVNRQSLIMALNNIIKNAYESLLSEGQRLRPGKIEISAAKGESSVVVKIADNGMGLSDNELKILLSRIPGRKNKSKRNSTGYGFPLACKYISAQGGLVDVESKEDKGTTVTVTLSVANTTK